MLVLTRKLGEEIVIGSGPSAIVVRVVEARQGRVRLGITAPPKVPVHRREMLAELDGRSLAGRR